jgi:hypothetical protein
MPYDYTEAPPPRDLDLIPPGTIATLNLHIRPGGVGEDEQLKRSKDGACEMLDCEFTVADGPHKGRKFWENFVLAGTTDGHAQAANSNRGKLKTIIDSALGLDPNDKSPQARASRTISLKQFQGMRFVAKIGVEKGRAKNDGTGQNWPDRNILAAVITPDRKEWRKVEQPPEPPPFDGGSPGGQAAPTNSAPPVTRPPWAA